MLGGLSWNGHQECKSLKRRKRHCFTKSWLKGSGFCQWTSDKISKDLHQSPVIEIHQLAWCSACKILQILFANHPRLEVWACSLIKRKYFPPRSDKENNLLWCPSCSNSTGGCHLVGLRRRVVLHVKASRFGLLTSARNQWQLQPQLQKWF